MFSIYLQNGEFFAFTEEFVTKLFFTLLGGLLTLFGIFIKFYLDKKYEKEKTKKEIEKLNNLFIDSLKFLINNIDILGKSLKIKFENFKEPDFMVYLNEDDYKIKIEILQIIGIKDIYYLFKIKGIAFEQYNFFLTQYYSLLSILKEYPQKVITFNSSQDNFKEDAIREIDITKKEYNEFLNSLSSKSLESKYDIFKDLLEYYKSGIKYRIITNQYNFYYKMVIEKSLNVFIEKRDYNYDLYKQMVKVHNLFEKQMSLINSQSEEFKQLNIKLNAATTELNKTLDLFN